MHRYVEFENGRKVSAATTRAGGMNFILAALSDGRAGAHMMLTRAEAQALRDVLNAALDAADWQERPVARIEGSTCRE